MAKFRVVVALVLSLLLVAPVSADDAKNKGLYISPLRKDTALDAGKSVYSSFTVANLTDKSMVVTLSIKQFSVSDYAYDYQFNPPNDNWITFDEPQVTLKPDESKQIPYTLAVPAKTAPGGHYYTLFASTTLSTGGLPASIQAATLLYVTVNGDLVRTSVLQKDSIPVLVTGTEVPYQFDVKNTGNVHYNAYFYGQLQGIFGKSAEVGTNHLLMPGAVRTVQSSIPSPILPGIYKATYGYKVDFANIITTKSSYIVFIPPWSIVAAIFLLLIGKWAWQRRKTKIETKN